ncbi:RBBP8 N-terminal-like protein [Eublepharis macularius]|uniref:RBBP8 N-terminal-like protein n=1 Tax=Eublepharis macularius TaxID=481883 RepID=A0AA97JH79_EUBMA|nr:RBBP8 N-terminal-like protein [Eublepharis macularius]
MAAENFAEFLNKLKEMHEKEVQGLQAKLNELTNEKCRDTQRIEELFAKNHQLREQQKVLKDNVKVLENRLRAGLCDRCQVTQELAKKKQHEFGKAHFQSLQHLFILTNEMNKMREENKSLKEELRKFCSMEDRSKPPRMLSRDGSSTPDSPLPLLSPRNRKSSPEKTAGHKSEDTPFRQRSSPDTRISPNVIFQGEHVSEMTSQKIANQLHGTIAFLRPGSRSSSQERDCTGNVSPPPVSKTPPSLQPARSPSLEVYSRASKTEHHEIASSYEMLKLAARKEQLCLLNQHFALRHLGLRKNSGSRDGIFPHHLLTAREMGGKTRSQDEWEDQASILDLPGAMVYMKDHHLENRLPFLNHQEKLQYLLVQQQELKDKMEVCLNPSQVRSPSPSLTADRECKKERLRWEDPAEGAREKWILINREDLEQTTKAETMREYLTEVPLDLSDYGRGRETLKVAKWQQLPVKHEAESPSRELREGPLLQKTSCSSQLSVARHLHASKESEKLLIKPQEDTAASLTSSVQELPISKTTSSDTAAGLQTKMLLGTEKQDSDRPDDADLESVKEESEEPNTSDSEVTGTGDDESFQGSSMKEKYRYIKENNQALPKKRKRGQDSGQKACKKSGRGRRNGKASQHPDNVQEVIQENNSQSPASSHNVATGET